MEGIIHVRIDARMIHGQVAAFWSNALRVNRIMVANDAVAEDEITKSALRMVAPSGMRTSLISLETAANNIKANKYAGQRVLLIITSPLDAIKMMDLGLDITSINVGNMSKRENTTQIKRSVSVTKEEAEAFHTLIERGVEVTSVMVPDEPKSYIIDYLEKSGL
ncbi:PTS system mannose/fructose/N-acetylgalactosamine-transporter subunit IIB [Amedibacillus sp. YH-ame10]